jgi:hypothetical protein
MGKCFIRALVLINPDDVSKVKSILDRDILKNFKFKKSKEWYLGDAKEVVYMQIKDKIEISIPELVSFQVNRGLIKIPSDNLQPDWQTAIIFSDRYAYSRISG